MSLTSTTSLFRKLYFFSAAATSQSQLSQQYIFGVAASITHPRTTRKHPCTYLLSILKIAIYCGKWPVSAHESKKKEHSRSLAAHPGNKQFSMFSGWWFPIQKSTKSPAHQFNYAFFQHEIEGDEPNLQGKSDFWGQKFSFSENWVMCWSIVKFMIFHGEKSWWMGFWSSGTSMDFARLYADCCYGNSWNFMLMEFFTIKNVAMYGKYLPNQTWKSPEQPWSFEFNKTSN